MDYIDMILIEEETTKHTVTAPENTFIPQLDDDTISTFGTVQNKKAKSKGLTRSTIANNNNDTLASFVIIDSRISVIEHDFSDMKDMSSRIFAKVNNDSEVTQPSIIQEAGSTRVPPTTEV